MKNSKDQKAVPIENYYTGWLSSMDSIQIQFYLTGKILLTLALLLVYSQVILHIVDNLNIQDYYSIPVQSDVLIYEYLDRIKNSSLAEKLKRKVLISFFWMLIHYVQKYDYFFIFEILNILENENHYGSFFTLFFIAFCTDC